MMKYSQNDIYLYFIYKLDLKSTTKSVIILIERKSNRQLIKIDMDYIWR